MTGEWPLARWTSEWPPEPPKARLAARLWRWLRHKPVPVPVHPEQPSHVHLLEALARRDLGRSAFDWRQHDDWKAG